MYVLIYIYMFIYVFTYTCSFHLFIKIFLFTYSWSVNADMFMHVCNDVFVQGILFVLFWLCCSSLAYLVIYLFILCNYTCVYVPQTTVKTSKPAFIAFSPL